MLTTISDIDAGLKRLDVALALAWEDIKDRYRRSLIGPSWIVLSFLAFVLVKTLIFSELFIPTGYDFFSHLVIGFALFGFISAAITEGTHIYVLNRDWILSTNLPYTTYAHTLSIRSLIELGLVGSITVVLVVLMGDTAPKHLWTLPFALIPYYASAIGLCMLFGPIGARYRDVVYAVQTITRILFFATPIIWIPTAGTYRELIATWNPLTYYLDIVRIPIIEGRVPLFSWLIVLAITTFLFAAGSLAFSKTKKNVPLWL